MAILLVLCGLGLVRLAGQDCVPLTYTTLSTLAGQPVPYSVWTGDLMVHGEPPDLETTLVKWYLRQPLIDLVAIDPACWTTTLKPGRPYVLICYMPMDEVVPDQEGNCHCCLVYFHEGGQATLVHTLVSHARLTEYITEELTHAEFEARLLFLFEVVPASPLVIRWKTLTD